ncbi:VOC family protein [Thalassospira sp. UBA1131]|uniref:VOC family protein n=1 Tax=Thalassospira sp. UBA1131 TaxID=1947672 RepID=UPI0025DE2759|nr:VOC family protein [Thalassospira sp. UBA1131]
MKVTNAYQIIITEKFTQSRAFYKKLGFTPVFDGDWYCQLVWPSAPSVQLGLMKQGHETQPPMFQAATVGEGTVLTLEVEEARDAADELREAGFEFALDLRDEPWGQRHFALLDPNGVRIDIASATAELSPEYAQQFKEAGEGVLA